jgi:hypothetical protein
MRYLTVIGALFGSLALAGPRQPAEELVGLWKAKRWFGPEARGPLVIQRTGSTYIAEMMAWTLPVRAERGELSFDLPDAKGSFRGRLQARGAIRGACRAGSTLNRCVRVRAEFSHGTNSVIQR